MNENPSKAGRAEIVSACIALAFAVYVIWKMRIDGFYPSEEPTLWAMVAVSGVCGVVSTRLRARRRAAAMKSADARQGVE